jgi:hypothetical protein
MEWERLKAYSQTEEFKQDPIRHKLKKLRQVLILLFQPLKERI